MPVSIISDSYHFHLHFGNAPPVLSQDEIFDDYTNLQRIWGVANISGITRQ